MVLFRKQQTPERAIVGTSATLPDGKPAALEDLYEMHEELGSGTFGIVRRGTAKADGREVAIKSIPMIQNLGLGDFGIGGQEISQGREIELRNEVDLMREIRHENAVRLTPSCAAAIAKISRMQRGVSPRFGEPSPSGEPVIVHVLPEPV